MKFSANIKSLLELVRDALLTLPFKSSDNKHEMIYLSLKDSTLTILADGGEMVYLSSVNVSGFIDGLISIEAKWLSEVLSSLDDEDAEFSSSELENSNDKLFFVKTNSGKFQIAAFDVKLSDIISFDYDSKSKYCSITAAQLKRISEKTLFSVSQDSMRISMTGVFFDLSSDGELKSIATDGHRLVKLTVKLSEINKEMQVVIPNRAMMLIQKCFIKNLEQKISIYSFGVDNTELLLVGETVTIKLSLITQKYPNYTAVIPLENDKKAVVERDKTIRSIKRVEKFSIRKDIRILFNQDSMLISAQNPDKNAQAEEIIPCSFSSNEELLIGFSAVFLHEAFSHIEDKEVVMELSSSTKATIILPKNQVEGENIIMLVMPVRVNV